MLEHVARGKDEISISVDRGDRTGVAKAPVELRKSEPG